MNQKKLLNQRIQRFRISFNKLNIYSKFTIIFFVIMLVGFLPIEIKNGSFLFSGLFTDRRAGIDGLKQHLVFMSDYVSHIKDNLFNGGIHLFRFDIGLGSDLINHYTYYSLFDPLTIIAYIIPIKYVEISYYLLIITRLYLSGIAIILLAKKINLRKDTTLLAVSIFYTFNIAILFSALRHPMFINGPMYFAFIMYGYELIKSKGSNIIFILSVFFALISQFYIFIYITFGFILFILIDTFKDFKNKKFNLFIKANLLYLLGVMIGGFVLLTQMFATLDGARLGSKGYELYQALDVAALIFANFLPLAADHYTAGIGNLIVFIICLYFIINEKKKTTYSIMFIILIVLSFSSIFSYLINMGSYVVNRWMFIITLPVSIIIGKYLEEHTLVNEKSILKTTKVFYVLFYIAILLLIATIINPNTIYSFIILGIISISLIFKIILVLKGKVKINIFKKLLESKNLYKYIIYNALISVLIVSGIYCFILTPKNALNYFYGSNDIYNDVIEEDGFYRVEQGSYVAGVNDFSNDGIYYGYPSTSSYNTMTNGNIIHFIEEYNINNSNNSIGYNGFDNRSRVLAINHVKYVIIRESDLVLPLPNFIFYKSIMVPKYDKELKAYHSGGNILKDENGNIIYEKANIYLNNSFLNFGIVFDSYLTKDDISNLNSVEKELLLTKTIVLDNDGQGIERYKTIEKSNKFIVRNFGLENIELIDNRLIVNSNNNSLKFKIPKIENEELYIEISGIKSNNKKQSFNTYYSTKYYSNIMKNYGYASNMYIENSEHLVNLGYYENEEDLEVSITFDEGIYEYINIGYYLLKQENLTNDISILNRNYLKDIKFGNSSFTGVISTEKSGYMFLSIPYSKGFKAYIDGVETEIIKANTGYMAVFVESRNKILEVKYFTPGLEIGLYISAASLIIFILIVRFELVYKISRNYQTNKNEEENEKNC